MTAVASGAREFGGGVRRSRVLWASAPFRALAAVSGHLAGEP